MVRYLPSVFLMLICALLVVYIVWSFPSRFYPVTASTVTPEVTQTATVEPAVVSAHQVIWMKESESVITVCADGVTPLVQVSGSVSHVTCPSK